MEKKYYSERNNLINQKLLISLPNLKKYYRDIFNFFFSQGFFELAEKGAWDMETNEQVLPPSLRPSPDVFIATRLNHTSIWPIYEYVDNYDEATLFSVIEIMYDHIGKYNFQTEKIEKDQAKKEYAAFVNAILRFYNNGFYLEPKNGFIMDIPNEALRNQLEENLNIPNEVMKKLASACRNYYRYDSDFETKKKAIATLADILEPERKSLKDMFVAEDFGNGNEHDKLIFEIVNKFSIRHNTKEQYTQYRKDIWYDWMMQYYTATIIAYYKLKTT